MSGVNSFETELAALKSIYDNDIRIEDRILTIRLHPLHNKDDTDAQIDLELIIPDGYPQILPNIDLKNVKGLSSKCVKTLLNELEELAKSKNGTQMIYDLACHVLNYLLDNNKPRRKSFYEEMMIRKEQAEAKSKLVETERIKRFHDAQKKVQKRMDNYSSDEDDFGTQVITSEKKKVHIGICNLDMCSTSKYIHFEKKVLRGRCIDHYECSTIYCAIDTMSGIQLAVHEWTLKPSQHLDQVKKSLESIEKELNYLKILCHQNLNSYIDFKLVTEKDEWVVYIAEKYISGVTLKTLIQQGWIVDLQIVQKLVKDILNGILYLHDRKVVHKNLNEDCIYINKSGYVKISNYSVPKRMDDLVKLCQNQETDGKADQKSDIKQLGIILNKVMELIPEQNCYNTNKYLDFKDFIDKCLIKNEERRWGAKELLDHKFLDSSKSYEIPGKVKSSHSNITLEPSDTLQDKLDFAVADQNSRLSREYDILEEVGKGSFGRVLKVRNKLDRQIYAIKEIKLDRNSKQSDKKIIREVNLLSKLKHENVVGYHTSWIDTYSETDESADKSKDEDEEDEDDDEDDSSDDEFCQKNNEQDDSSVVVFLDEDKSSHYCSSPSEKSQNKISPTLPTRIMYIQMEYCEKSTLKYAIQSDLYKQEERRWRLLREIVEGLTYIHEQGFIHRDLKPDNIFLDLNDHVKIGDFGLAKIRGMPKHTLMIITEISLGGGEKDCSYHTTAESGTAGVGTSFYIAPEVSSSVEKSHYNEKVDIYSLGIIFFEMCHPPFNTGMERHDVLTKLRRAEIVIPATMEENMPMQMKLVRMSLNRDPASRPTSQEILEEYVPPAEIEFEELKAMVRKTLSSPESKGYRYLVSSCLNQKTNVDNEMAYQLQYLQCLYPHKFHITLDAVKEVIENIFKSCGAIYLPTSMILRQNDVHANSDSCVKLMTQSGAVVNLPHDLRIPFARYVTSGNIRRLRRYHTDRVHRERGMQSVPSKELYECAYDIVSPKSGKLSDELEILSAVDKVIKKIPSLKAKNCVIVMNHSLILRALLTYCNAEKYYSEIFKYLMDVKLNKSPRSRLRENLLSLELGDQVVTTLVTYFEKEESIYTLKEEILYLFNNRQMAYEKAKNGFDQLMKIISETECYGINIPIKIRLGVVCNTEYCRDFMFNLVCKTKRKHGKETNEVIMTGCRFDGLLEHFRKLYSDNKELSQSAIGVSISLGEIVSLIKEDDFLSEYVVVFSTDDSLPAAEKKSFLEELRAYGIKCYFEDAIDNMDELKEFCSENKITHIVNLKEDNCQVVVMSWDSGKCRYQEKKMSKRDVAEAILNKNFDDRGVVTYQRSENKPWCGDVPTANQCLNIHIILEEKSFARRKQENQIKSKMLPLLRHFSSKTRVEVVGVDLDEMEICRLAMLFKEDDNSYESNILPPSARSSKKCYLSKICDKLQSFFIPRKSSLVIVIYGLAHDKYQFIMN